MPAPVSLILAATDGTGRSRAVLDRAGLLARPLAARLALVHVRAPHRARFRLAPAEISDAELGAQLEAQGGSLADLHVIDGPPAERIVGLAQRLGASLVVTGLHRARRVLDTFRLTTLERVTLGLDCPILVTREMPVRPYARVLAALTFGPADAEGLRLAATIAPGATLRGIHALPHPLTRSRAEREACLDNAQARRAAFLQAPSLPKGLALPEIVPGGVHEVLRFRVAEFQPDLLVVGRGSGADPTRLGNYTRDLMQAPLTDLLVTRRVPPDAGTSAMN